MILTTTGILGFNGGSTINNGTLSRNKEGYINRIYNPQYINIIFGCVLKICMYPQSGGSFDCGNSHEPMHGMGEPFRETYVQLKTDLDVMDMEKPWGNLWK